MKLILGSQSPRRVEILRFFSLPFLQISSPFDEASLAFSGNFETYAQALSEGKGEALSTRYPADAILTADTIVCFGNRVFGKPKSVAHAIEMLWILCGRWHRVITAVSMTRGGICKTEISSTRVLLHSLTESQMRTYVQANRTLDKAGAYAVQGKGSLIVEKIEGCFYNVMGLPLQPVAKLLKGIGINLWDCLD